jgi:hypothetical protein
VVSHTPTSHLPPPTLKNRKYLTSGFPYLNY